MHEEPFDWMKVEKREVDLMKVLMEFLGDEHPEVLSSMHNLAYMYHKLGRWSEAEKLAAQALDLRRKVLGDEHCETLSSMHNLAYIYHELGRWSKAEELAVEALDLRRKFLGDEYPDTLSSMHSLAYMYYTAGRWDEAEALEARALEIHKIVLGTESPSTLASEHILASIYANQGRLKEAEGLYTSVIEARKRIIGSRHPDTLESMHNLASIYRGLGRFSEAVILEGEVLESYNIESETGPDRMLASMHVSASKYMNQGRHEEADMLEVHALEISNTKFTLLDQRPPLTGEPKGIEGDSGYGSLRAPTTTVPSVSDLQNGIDAINYISSLEKAEDADDTKLTSDDDIRSVVSEGDDIRSQASDATTNEGMTGKALIRAFLAEQPQFKALCEKALDKMNRRRFIENMSRLLKSFHKGLAEEAKSEAEKVVTRLLRSKRGRRRISEQLAAHIDMEHEETQDKIDLEIPSSKMQNVEDWLSQAMKPSSIEDVELAVEQDSDAMEMDSEDGNEPYSFPYISELKAFLLASKAFQSLQIRFALMFLSADLGDMLQSIPKESIWLSQEQDVSISNRLKILVENTTKARWNWWPLSQGKRMLNPGESRLFWNCVSALTTYICR
ncbi:hypothetical protein THARTR1_05540 [Trichoderma harzianum]|uniref:Uncharacterized protein n=1 Tax=Trichoderma harzianum TaxID=5544 RepID=A0A2K0U988_TRIHA|nr:hypothetical protein THARTR1_05540 [Trichoderma harzianum]